jgi:hypothetical protein
MREKSPKADRGKLKMISKTSANALKFGAYALSAASIIARQTGAAQSSAKAR